MPTIEAIGRDRERPGGTGLGPILRPILSITFRTLAPLAIAFFLILVLLPAVLGAW